MTSVCSPPKSNVSPVTSISEACDGWIVLPVNELYCGDNLEILREYIAPESVDLVYLDPPFKSDQNYNLLFREKDGSRSHSQILAFEDTWEWNREAERAYDEIVEKGGKLAEVMALFRVLFDKSDMLAYLSMMAPRLEELRRVLRPSGALYLHCDPTASHYLKMLLDAIFGAENFQNELVWKRTSAHFNPKRWGPVHDVILFYSKSDGFKWNTVYQTYDESYLKVKYRNKDERGHYRLSDLTGAGWTKGDSGKDWRGFSVKDIGRHWAVPKDEVAATVGEEKAATLTTQQKLDALDKNGFIYWTPRGKYKGRGFPQFKRYLAGGVPIQDVVSDISPVNSQAKERIGYPTQKPIALLERIICASSEEGDIILDPFCGCGTAIEAAHAKNRRWIGIDLTKVAIDVVKDRLAKIGEESGKTYQTIWEPRDISTAKALAADDPFQFQDWIIKKLGGLSTRHRGADRGIDGRIYFKDSPTGSLRQIIVSVKSGKITPAFVRELHGTVDREKAAMGILATLATPTKATEHGATTCGFYKGLIGTYPLIQIVTAEMIFAGVHTANLPPIQRIASGQRRPSSSTALQFSLPGMAKLNME